MMKHKWEKCWEDNGSFIKLNTFALHTTVYSFIMSYLHSIERGNSHVQEDSIQHRHGDKLREERENMNEYKKL